MKNPMNVSVSYVSMLLIVCSLGQTVLLLDLAVAQNTRAVITVNVGVVVDNDTWIGKMGLSCIEMAVSDFYRSNSHYKTRIVLHHRDSKSDLIGAASSALDLIQNVEVQAIIGLMASTQAKFIANLGERAQIPIVSISTSDPSLSRSSYFFQATQSGVASQAKALSALVTKFGWKRVVLIVSDRMYGEGLIPCLTEALEEVDAYASYVSVISSSTSDAELVEELRKLTAMKARVFIAHTDVPLGTRIFTEASEIGMMKQGYVWITTNEMTSFLSSVEPLVMDSMQGVLGIKAYIPETTTRREFRARWKNLQLKRGDFELNAFGLWAYDAATALAMAVERVGNNVSFGFEKRNVSGNSRDLETFGASKSGPELVKALSNLKLINGLSGNFTLASRQLGHSSYQIVNVYGNGQKVVGLLTLQNTRQSNSTRSKTRTGYSTWNVSDLAPIIWPGESVSVPQGWDIGSSSTRVLRVGFPVSISSSEFVDLEHDPSTGETVFKGYSVEIFDTVRNHLPYALHYKFIPFSGTYNELVYQVYLGEFDAALGDITITANRSLYADFTYPYSETGVSIIMPVKLSNTGDTWIFLKPWKWGLWVIVAFFFIFNAYVVWILEHKANKDFQGPPLYQIGTSLWFSFSTMVYAHQEKVVNNLARFVVLVWIFAVLILTQCYAANLTSFLTVRQLQPPKTELVMTDLLRSGNTVAFGSPVVYGGLRSLGFDDSQLRRYNTNREAHELMSNGDVAAIVNEVPYNKLFLAQYCSDRGYYDITERNIRADGFGFVFQRGSPLLPDFSRALMKLRSGSDDEMQMENKWFGRKPNCKDPNEEVAYSNRLGPESFWGLFFISGVSSLSALAIHAFINLRSQRQNVTISTARKNASAWIKTISSFTLFRKNESNSHEKRTELAERQLGSGSVTLHGVVPVESIENAIISQPIINPSSHSNHADINAVLAGNKNQGPSISCC